jgi:hypothetical protein
MTWSDYEVRSSMMSLDPTPLADGGSPMAMTGEFGGRMAALSASFVAVFMVAVCRRLVQQGCTDAACHH